MNEKPLFEKMRIKPGKSIAFVDVPASLGDLAAGLPAGVDVARDEAPADIILLFTPDRAAAARALPAVQARLKPGGALWVAFYKGNVTDINRDSLFTLASGYGLQACANISIDEQWSALRLKVVE